MFKTLRDAWYGPRTIPFLEITQMERRDILRSGVVTVTDVAEAVALAESRFESALTPAMKDRGLTVARQAHGRSGTLYVDVDFATLPASEWSGLSATVGYATVNLDGDISSRLSFEETIGVYFSPTSAQVYSSTGTTGPGITTLARPDQHVAAADAHSAMLAALAGAIERRTPPVRLRQVRAVAPAIVVLAAWAWAMFVAKPPLALWVFTGMVAAAVAYAGYRFSRLDPNASDEIKYGVVRVDLTPREKVLADRANRRADLKSRIVGAVVFSPIAAAAGAWILYVVGPR